MEPHIVSLRERRLVIAYSREIYEIYDLVHDEAKTKFRLCSVDGSQGAQTVLPKEA